MSTEKNSIVNVGGGAYIGGNIKISGNTIKRDVRTRNITTRNYVEGNISGGNIAGRDVNVENFREKKLGDQNITIGNGNIIHGSVVAAQKIANSFNNLQESKANDKTQDLLGELLNEIKALNDKVPAAQAQAVEKMASRADGLVAESKNETPDKEWYQLSLKGIKEAALTVGEIAKPVLAVAERLAALLL